VRQESQTAKLVNWQSYLLATASFAHYQNFSAAGLGRPFGATMATPVGFGSGVICRSFTRFPKL
jgi:hypothetical protein